MNEFIPIPDKWQRLVSALEFTVRFASKAWTIQTDSFTWEIGPYLQVQYLGDQIYAEITCNDFLQPKLSSDQQWMLHFLGWEVYEEEERKNFPNWTKIVPHTVDGHREIAELWVRSLLYIYGMDEKWRFQIGIIDSIFLNEWRRLMIMSSRKIGRFQLETFDRRFHIEHARAKLEKAKEAARLELDRLEQAKLEQAKKDAQVVYGIESIFREAKKLRLQGTDLIRLASARQKPEVVKAITELVNTGHTAFGYTPPTALARELGLYQEIEFDELSGQEFSESQQEKFD